MSPQKFQHSFFPLKIKKILGSCIDCVDVALVSFQPCMWNLWLPDELRVQHSRVVTAANSSGSARVWSVTAVAVRGSATCRARCVTGGSTAVTTTSTIWPELTTHVTWWRAIPTCHGLKVAPSRGVTDGWSLMPPGVSVLGHKRMWRDTPRVLTSLLRLVTHKQRQNSVWRKDEGNILTHRHTNHVIRKSNQPWKDGETKRASVRAKVQGSCQ